MFLKVYILCSPAFDAIIVNITIIIIKKTVLNLIYVTRIVFL